MVLLRNKVEGVNGLQWHKGVLKTKVAGSLFESRGGGSNDPGFYLLRKSDHPLGNPEPTIKT